MPNLKIQEVLDPILYSVLSEVTAVCTEMQLDYFVGGAMARDIWIRHVYGQNTLRATRDVDIGLYIKDWSIFEALKAKLVATGKFKEGSNGSQSLIYKPVTPLDLIPFGGVADKQSQISWPPKNDIVLSVVGFEEALEEAIPIDIGNGLIVKTCSIPSLVALKLVAWVDRNASTNKDAYDFFRIVKLYGEVLNLDRLYNNEQQLLERSDYDPVLAGAVLLGKDTVQVCKPETIKVIMGIKRIALTDQIEGVEKGSDQEKIEALVNAFFEGFSEAQ